jgi:hypothetical protein
MQPYVIRQGDYLHKIAHRFDFDADSVWNDPSNDDLRKLRPDPNLLFPGDLLHIPDQQDPPGHKLAVGTTNEFEAPDAPTATVTQTFVGTDPADYASRAFTVSELDQLTGLTTDADGKATFPVPVTLDAVTVVFTDTGETWRLRIGHMDPIDTLAGVFKRLQNLGCIGGNAVYDAETLSNNIDVIREGLRVLKDRYADDDDAGDSDDSDSSPDSTGPDGDGSDDDDQGLSDEGALDADTRNLLRDAHGC